MRRSLSRPSSPLSDLFRSGTTKANKTSHDADYKSILDTFVTDLLAVLYRPEWPAASLYVNVLSRLMVCLDRLMQLISEISPLEDLKTSAEATAARSTALDYLGDIAAQLRSFHLEMHKKGAVPSIDEVRTAYSD